MELTAAGLALVAVAAVAGGAVNAIAGGGTLITFPALTAVGIPPVAASVTNTVALAPGYLGGVMAQQRDLAGQRRRLLILAPTGALGGLVGAILLLNSGEQTFRTLVPWLILMATGLLAFQDQIRGWVVRRLTQAGQDPTHEAWTIPPVFLAAVYGGYFGAGLRVILLAVLGLVIHDTLTRVNALKQGVAFAANIAAALLFVFSGQVVWEAALVMAVGSLLGGVLGGRLAGRIPARQLRQVVVTIGVIVAGIYLYRG